MIPGLHISEGRSTVRFEIEGYVGDSSSSQFIGIVITRGDGDNLDAFVKHRSHHSKSEVIDAPSCVSD